MSAEKPKGINTGRIITIVVVALLVGATGFFAYKFYEEKNKNEVQVESIDGLTAEINDLETNLEDYQDDLENKDLDLEEKERLLAEKEQLLVDKQKKIDQLLASNKITTSQASDLRGKVEQLEYYIKKYQTEITELRAELDATKEVNEQLTAEVGNIKGEVRDLRRAKETVDFKLETAAILNAHTFTYYRMKGSGKAIEESSFRRGQMDDFRSCFRLNQNLAAEIGSRDLYIQIKNPSGKVIKDEAGGQSGYFTYEDQDIAYTLKKVIEYDRTTQEVCFDFVKPESFDYEKGIHSVVIYCEGYDIGHGKFEVK
jgi:FtsZ-binding cell division protein ZapB